MADGHSRSGWQPGQVRFRFLFPVLTVFLVLPLAAASVPAFFIFGDDFVDVGTNNYLKNATLKANFRPYGENYIPASGRFSDGKLFVDYIAKYMGFPASPPPFNQPNANFSYGVNFASAGASIANPNPVRGKHITPVDQLQRVDAGRQMREFRNFLKSSKNPFTKEQISNSLFLICFGLNDLETLFLTGCCDSYGGQIIIAGILHRFGARKFVVLSAPAVGCLPTPLTLGYDTTPYSHGTHVNSGPIPVGKQCFQGFAYETQVENSSLFQYLSEEFPFPNSKIAIADFLKITLGLHNHKTKHGFASNYPCCGAGFNKAQVRCGTNRTVNGITLHGSACPNPSRHWSWDGVGFTQKANEQIAKAFWSGPQSMIWPMNISQIVAD